MDLLHDIVAMADCVVGTMSILLSFRNKTLIDPIAIFVEEAGQMHEADAQGHLHVFPSTEAWVFTGDPRQVLPFLASKFSTVPKDDDARHSTNLLNSHAPALQVSFKERFSRQRPDDVTYLKINHRVEGGLEELASEFGYSGKMESPKNETIYTPTANIEGIPSFCTRISWKAVRWSALCRARR